MIDTLQGNMVGIWVKTLLSKYMEHSAAADLMKKKVGQYVSYFAIYIINLFFFCF